MPIPVICWSQDPALKVSTEPIGISIPTNAQVIGCVHVESPAMRMLLKKLKADEYPGLVAANSVVRPGVARSGMMRQYILRFRHPEERDEAHLVLRNLMPETCGVMVYQEGIIKVAHYFAGLILGEADVLQRGMSGKYRSRDEFQKVKQKFFDNCKAKIGQLAGKIVEKSEFYTLEVDLMERLACVNMEEIAYQAESLNTLTSPS